jgi:hypothetical protein
MKNSWSIVLVGLIGLVIGGLYSVPRQTEASKPRSNYSDAVSGLTEIENRLTLLAANLEKQQSTKFEQAAVNDVAEVVKADLEEYATKAELSDLRTDLMAEIESRIPKPVVEAVKSSPSVGRSESVPSTYQARWTHPSTIENHMAVDHGVSTAGKTKAQLLAEHDAIHDGIGPVHTTKTTTVNRSRATYSSCPGGVCPTPQSAYSTSVNRFRVFRR